MELRDTAAHCAVIGHAGWWVRHYAPQRTPLMRARRAAAIRAMGLAVRRAFNESEDFEPLLTAILDGLVPREPRF